VKTVERVGVPHMGAILHEEKTSLIAPRAPSSAVLREPQVVDQEQRTRSRTNERLEFSLVGLKSLRRFIEARDQSCAHQRLDLGTAIERRCQDLFSSSAEASVPDAVPERVPPLREEPAAGFGEREGDLTRRPSQGRWSMEGGPQFQVSGSWKGHQSAISRRTHPMPRMLPATFRRRRDRLTT
jgi:hypothetical protein